MGKVISVINQKGGVGKTTTSIHIAVSLSKKYPEEKILLIDLDSQRNSTGVMLKKVEFPQEETIYQAFQSKVAGSRLIHDTHLPNLFAIPGSLNLIELENQLAGTIDGFFRLSEGLSELLKEFRYIFIDCPPSLSIVTINAMVASNYLIIPLQTSKFSLDGIHGILEAVKTVQKRYNPYLQIMGGLLTFFQPRNTLSRVIPNELEKYLPLFKTRIPQSVAVEEAHLLKMNLMEYAPQNKVAQAYDDLAGEIHGIIG